MRVNNALGHDNKAEEDSAADKVEEHNPPHEGEVGRNGCPEQSLDSAQPVLEQLQAKHAVRHSLRVEG